MAPNVIAANSSASLLLSEMRTERLPLGVAEAIPDASHGEQVLGVLGVALDLLAQVTDVNVDRARVAVGGIAPDPGQQHVPGEHATGRAGEGGEDLELDERQLRLVAAYADRALREIDPHLPDEQRRLIGRGL